MSAASLEPTISGERDETFILRVVYEAISEEAVSSSLNRLRRAGLHQMVHFPEVITYHFALCEPQTEKLKLEFTEIYANEAVFWNHAKESFIANALKPLFTPQLRKSAQIVCAGRHVTEGVKAVISSLGGHCVPLIAGFLSNPTSEKKLGDAIICILSCTPKKPELRDELISVLRARTGPAIRDSLASSVAVACVLQSPSSADTLQLIVVCSTSFAMRQVVCDKAIAKCCDGMVLHVYGRAIDMVEKGDIEECKKFDIEVRVRRSNSGYALHPQWPGHGTRSASQREHSKSPEKLSKTAEPSTPPRKFSTSSSSPKNTSPSKQQKNVKFDEAVRVVDRTPDDSTISTSAKSASPAPKPSPNASGNSASRNGGTPGAVGRGSPGARGALRGRGGTSPVGGGMSARGRGRGSPIASSLSSKASPPPKPPAPKTATTSPSSNVQTETTSAPPQKKLSSPPSGLFTLRYNEYSDAPEAFQFSTTAAGRSAHQYRGSGVAAVPRASASSDSEIVIPLLHLLRKLSSSGHLDTIIPIEIAFSQLERVRALNRDLKFLDEQMTAANGDDASGLAHHRIERLLDNLNTLGYAVKENKKLVIEEVDAFIGSVEEIYKENIEAARNALKPHSYEEQTVTYMGLQEYFTIGTIVCGKSNGLGGTMVGYRVLDCYYTPQRSLFGGKQFTFHLALECIANLGTDFVVFSFEEVLDKFEGTKSVAALPYRRATASERLELTNRGMVLAHLGVKPAFRAYKSACFYAHRTAKDLLGASQSSAGGNAAQLSTSGRVMIDNNRGLMLGHNPGVSYDNAGIGLLTTLKQYRSAMRAAPDGESFDSRAQRVREMGFFILQRVEYDMVCMTWPAVLGFSFNAKVWGHVLVDGLSEVEFQKDAWDGLVIPADKKELLTSLVTQQYASDAPNLRHVMSNRGGGGSLFLLHGPPGSGKTMTVEALAERFERPLYSITFGELGTSVAQLEERLGEVLLLCAGWGAFVLLDEGDALVEKREKGQLLLNSMTGVLLKFLDSFEGLLFITSNRITSFDPAALSRVTLAIRYEAFSREDLGKVWRLVLKRAGVRRPSAFGDIKRLVEADPSLSGRDVNSIVRIAMAISYTRKTALSMDIVLHSIRLSSDFRRDFAKQGSSAESAAQANAARDRRHRRRHRRGGNESDSDSYGRTSPTFQHRRTKDDIHFHTMPHASTTPSREMTSALSDGGGGSGVMNPRRRRKRPPTATPPPLPPPSPGPDKVTPAQTD